METLKSLIKKIKWETVLTAIIAIVVGIVFIVTPASSGAVLCYVAGVMILALGIYFFVKFFTARLAMPGFLVYGIMLMLLGIFCLTRPGVVLGIITVVFGIYLVMDGLFKVRDGIQCVRDHIKGGWMLFILAALTIVLGLIVMFGSFDSIMVMAGVSLIIDGICDIIATVYYSAYVHKVKKTVKKEFERSRMEDVSDVVDVTDSDENK